MQYTDYCALDSASAYASASSASASSSSSFVVYTCLPLFPTSAAAGWGELLLKKEKGEPKRAWNGAMVGGGELLPPPPPSSVLA